VVSGSRGGAPAPGLGAGVAVRVLGGFSVSVGGEHVAESAFSRKKARALLKLLAIQPGYRLHRDQAIDVLWPDLEPQAASAQLYKAVHHIRQALAGTDPRAGDSLASREGLLELSGEISSDLEVFERLAQDAERHPSVERLERAVAAYTGDLLPADRYEEWTLSRRDALRDRSTGLFANLGASLLDHRDLASAADAFRRVLAVEPAREDAHRGLMQVFALQGSRDRAARQYRVCVDALDRELGVGPSAETDALLAELESGALGGVSAHDDLGSTLVGLMPAMVGRDADLAIVAGLMELMGDERGGLLIVEGPAGIGKTRLLHEVLQRARTRGYGVGYGSARAKEGRFPYAPLIDALRMLLRDDPTAAEHLPAELGIAMRDIAVGPAAGSADRLASRSALFAAVLRFLSVRARHTPLVLVLDDLHVADEGTLRALAYLGPRVDSHPIMLIASWRTEEPETARVPKAFEDAVTARITLGPLSPSDHHALVSQSLGGAVDARATEQLFVFGRGNPLFTTELIRQLSAGQRLVRAGGVWELAEPARLREPTPVPASLHALMVERLEGLSDAGRGLLDVASVIGESVPLDVLLTTAPGERTGEAILDLISEAIDARLIVETGLGYRFFHPLLREGVLRQIPEVRRRALHRRVARTLEEVAPEKDRPVESLAYHYSEAGEIGAAVKYLLAAAGRAESVYDHDDAALRLREALALLAGEQAPERVLQRAEVQELLGDVHRAVGRIHEGVDAYQAALAALGHSDSSRHAELHRKIALGLIMVTDIPAATEHLAQARHGSPLPLEEARNLIVEALLNWHMNQLQTSVVLAEHALAIAEREGAQREIAQACEMLALAHLPQGNWDEGLRYELRREADWSPDLVLATDAHMCLWEYRIRGEDPHRRAKAFIDTVTDQAATMGNLRCLAVCHYALGSIGLSRGDFAVARDHLARSLDLNERLGSPAGVAFTLSRLINLAADLGESQGIEMFERAMEVGAEAAVRDHALMMVHGAGMRNRLIAGDQASATEIMRSAERLEAESNPCPVCSVEMLPIMAAVHLKNGDPEAARACAERAAQLAEMGHNQVGAARAAAAIGRIHASRGEAEDAAAFFQRAAEAFRDLGHRFELATTLRALGDLPGGSSAQSEAEQILASLVLAGNPGKVLGSTPS
jgi:DNA-binding SARP family transcriptional activator